MNFNEDLKIKHILDSLPENLKQFVPQELSPTRKLAFEILLEHTTPQYAAILASFHTDFRGENLLIFHESVKQGVGFEEAFLSAIKFNHGLYIREEDRLKVAAGVKMAEEFIAHIRKLRDEEFALFLTEGLVQDQP